MPPFFIAVHAGAGYHGNNREAAYKAAMRSALKAASDVLKDGDTSMDAVKAAIRALENASITNAGYGSNLTLDGGVECDASIMAGDGTFAAVGAVPGLDNPIAAAHRLAELSRVPLPCGLVRPVFLVGDAARRWAISEGLAGASDAQLAGQRLVSPASKAAWQTYASMLAAAQPACGGAAAHTPPEAKTAGHTTPHTNSQQQEAEVQQPTAKRACLEAGAPTSLGKQPPGAAAVHKWVQQHQAATFTASADATDAVLGDMFDTVGCVVVDGWGCVAAGVSSGGLALKQAGRVGEAAVAGAGCWAADGSHAAHPAAPQLQQRKVLQTADSGAAGAPVALPSTPGVAVSVSGVGERIIAATLAKAAAMQLQVAVGQRMEPLMMQLVQTSLLSQQGPWDAGILAVRVNSSSSSMPDEADSSSSGGGSTPDAAAEVQVSQLNEPVLAGNHALDCSLRSPGQQQQQQQQRLRVELVAAFTSHSFAVGWVGPLQHDQPQLEVLRRHGHAIQEPGSADGLEAPSVEGTACLPLAVPTVKCLETSCSWSCAATVPPI